MRPQAKEIRHWQSGRTWKLFDLGVVSEQRYGAPYIFIHRGDLHRLLVEAVRAQRPDVIRLNARCVGVEQDADHVVLVLEDGRRGRGRLLIGADGVHSAVRASVFGAGRPEFTGCMAWRGVIPVERLGRDRMPLAGTNWIGPGRHVVHCPLRRGELLNFVGVVERGDWLVESWTAQGTQGECLSDFARLARRCARVDRGHRRAVQVGADGARGDDALERGARDAARRCLPCRAAVPGPGAAMAIEDAFVLARALSSYGDDHATAFARYEAARIPRTTKVVDGSAANTKRFHDPRLADDSGAEAYIASEWSEEKIAQRYDWLFRYDVERIEV